MLTPIARWLCAVLLVVSVLWGAGACTRPAAPPKQTVAAGVEAQQEVEPPVPPALPQHPEAAPVDKAPRRTPVARILGTEILDEDLVPRSREQPNGQPHSKRELRDYHDVKLSSLIWDALREKYCLTHAIEATPEEIEQYKRAMKQSQDQRLERLRAQLAAEDTTDDERRRISQEILEFEQPPESPSESLQTELPRILKESAATEAQQRVVRELTRLLGADRADPPLERLQRFFEEKLKADNLSDEDRENYTGCLEWIAAVHTTDVLEKKLPEAMVKQWKFDRALHAEYGGTVIFQQFNPCEPVGAYRKWLKAHEEAGDFEIVDEGARQRFWRYYIDNDQPTTWAAHDPDPLGQPWWLKKPAEAKPE